MKTTTEIKDQIVRKGAAEIVESLLANQVFFDTEGSLRGWAEELFDFNVLGQSSTGAEYDEVNNEALQKLKLSMNPHRQNLIKLVNCQTT